MKEEILCFVVGVCGGLAGMWTTEKANMNLADMIIMIVVSILTTLLMNGILR